MKATKLYEEKVVDAHEEHHEHHEQSFIRKYIFSEDHKTIAKQFLITGIFWAILGGALSFLFRIQLGFPDMDLTALSPIIGNWLTPQGKIDPCEFKYQNDFKRCPICWDRVTYFFDNSIFSK